MLTASPTDVLSHVAIRARSQGVLLATCFDEAQLETLKVGIGNPNYQVHSVLATCFNEAQLK